MKIAVLGVGCSKCEKLYENAREALEMTGINGEVVKVQDISKISSYKVFMTPALVINDKVKSVGKIIKPEQIKKWIEETD